MNDEEIFGQNEYENYINFNGSRVCFALARRCKLYKYDKKIGVNLSLYTDFIDPESFKLLYKCNSEPVDCYFDTTFVVYANIEVFNFSSNSYERLDEFVFDCCNKKWFTNELKLSSCHISDNSEVKINISYQFGKIVYATRGFIGKKQYKDFYREFGDTPNITLVSTLTSEDSIGRRNHDNDEWEGF